MIPTEERIYVDVEEGPNNPEGKGWVVEFHGGRPVVMMEDGNFFRVMLSKIRACNPPESEWMRSMRSGEPTPDNGANYGGVKMLRDTFQRRVGDDILSNLKGPLIMDDPWAEHLAPKSTEEYTFREHYQQKVTGVRPDPDTGERVTPERPERISEEPSCTIPERRSDSVCAALQYSDQMVCDACDMVFDVNDPDPPKCLITGKNIHSSGPGPTLGYRPNLMVIDDPVKGDDQ